MRKHTIHSVLPALLCAVLAWSCDREGVGVSDRTVRIGAVSDNGTRAGGTGATDSRPLFVFWTDGHFNDQSAGAPHFFTRIPGGEIDDYAVEPYNTGVFYPLRDREVHAVGLAPAPGEGGLLQENPSDFTRFVIPGGDGQWGDDAHGVHDILTSGFVTGKDSEPIAAPLVFRHVLSQLSFRAILAPTMTKFVKFVTIDFPGSLAPVAVNWDGGETAYTVEAGTDALDGFTFGNYWTDDGRHLAEVPRANATHFYMPSKDKATSMGLLYIMPPDNSEITVTVNYKMCDTVGGFDLPDPANPVRDISKEVTISFSDEDGNPVPLGAGDAVTVTLVFDAADIELVGQLRPWGDGGHVSLPFQPTK